MDFTEKQKNVIQGAINLYNIGQKIITIAGPAGSGKTTILNEIIKGMKLSSSNIEYAAFTGKACLVLRQKGIPAYTLHSLMYDCEIDEKDRPIFFKRKNLENIYCKLIVVDEIGMVGQKLLEDLLSFNIPILATGDPYQLEPVLDNPTNLLQNPDFLLTEIHRQKNGNSILELGEQIRVEKRLFSNYDDDYIRTINKQDFNIQMILWADQVLCSTHKIRKDINNTVRQYKNYKNPYPEVGDKMICLKNYHNIVSKKNQEPLVNGTIGYITRITKKILFDFNSYMDVEFRPDWDMEDYYLIRIDLNEFCGYAPYKNIRNFNPSTIRTSFDYAYAITVHKSQGSEWNKVLIYSSDAFGDKSKILYTAVTRARDKIIYVQ